MRSVILPSENQTREFEAKLLLACVLATRGFEVVVGARHTIHNRVADFAPSIYIAKDFRKPSERILKLIEGLGHCIVAWDEEGFVQPVPSLYYERRYSLDAISRVKHVFAWGEDNAALMKGAPQWPDIPIHGTGNPRLDLLRPELRGFHTAASRSLKDSYGRFVLFDTNFASFNPAIKSVAPILNHATAKPSLYVQGRFKLYERWKAMIPALAEQLGEVKLIIRPHPAEDHGVWQSIAETRENIKVVHQGSAVPWILAADVMIHSGCTTGVEAYLLGRQSISFRPENLTTLEDDLPDYLSAVVNTEELLIKSVIEVLNGRVLSESVSQQRRASRAAYAMDKQLASERIGDVVQSVAAEAMGSTSRKLNAVLGARVRQLEKGITGLNPKHKTSDAMNALRFPGISLAEIRDMVSRFQACVNISKDIVATDLGDNIFKIRPSSNGTATPARTGDL
jgi:surface carbohydrate biosynthesis protein